VSCSIRLVKNQNVQFQILQQQYYCYLSLLLLLNNCQSRDHSIRH